MPQRFLRDLGRQRGSAGRIEEKARKQQHPNSSTPATKKTGRPKKQTGSRDSSSSVEKPQVNLDVAEKLTRSNVPTGLLDGMPSSPLTASPDYLEKHLDRIQPDPEYMRWLETRHLAMVKDSDCKGGISLSTTGDEEAYERALDCWFPIPTDAS